jgi:hypothetical protein
MQHRSVAEGLRAARPGERALFTAPIRCGIEDVAAARMTFLRFSFAPERPDLIHPQ